MATTKTRTTAATAVGTVRTAVARWQAQAERTVSRLRSEAQTLAARSRREVLKEVRHLERRLSKALHGSMEQRLHRLEARIARLERGVGAKRKYGRGSIA